MKNIIACFIALAFSGSVVADSTKTTQAIEDKSITKHSVTIKGKKVNYTATAQYTTLNKDGQPDAKLFSITYTKDGVKDTSKRPVAFFYNGGPGSSSVWLHMGAWGPEKIILPSDAKDDGAAPFNIAANNDSLLDVTDMVFIDPIGTGFSHTVGDGEGKTYWGLREDAASVATFIRTWLRRNGRWNSPKYIGGESYGTTRSAMLINALEGRYDDVSINGIILISTILDFSVYAYAEGAELAYMTALPTMAATAQYHGKAGGGVPLADFVEQARQFAVEDYAPALLLGSKLKGKKREEILKGLMKFTGLSKRYLELANLRVHYQEFNRELLRDEGYSVGRLDSRFKGKEVVGNSERPEIDPSFYGIDGGYTAALNHWVRDRLKFNPDREYTIIGGVRSWNWKIGTGMWREPYMNVTQFIGKAMRGNKDLRVFNAAGYYDFATPLLGAEYALDRSGIDPARVTYTYYPAGHMMYIHHPSLKQLNDDIRSFINGQ
ncbi:peptidase S10 [Temperatibacter marinus]|uniref:Peptidase S10 n=1 Tax=Temperatibacter marinus TaxID=1456591 RepID=A0AA52H8Y6_9PROT|nr:peptidase S10 [Temperatibacter marinus]WND01957.1 peptidase S10 [Temperatibacter marinus]